jgi:hypothetical protein
MRPAISLDNVALCNDTSCARTSVTLAAAAGDPAGSDFWASAALAHNAVVRPASNIRSRIVRSGRSVTALHLVTAWLAELLHLDHAIGSGATAGVRIGPSVRRLSVLALQLPFLKISESMGNHDSKIVDADSVD